MTTDFNEWMRSLDATPPRQTKISHAQSASSSTGKRAHAAREARDFAMKLSHALAGTAAQGVVKVAMELTDASAHEPLSMSEAGRMTRQDPNAAPTPENGMAAQKARTEIEFASQPMDQGNLKSISPNTDMTGANGNLVPTVNPSLTVTADAPNNVEESINDKTSAAKFVEYYRRKLDGKEVISSANAGVMALRMGVRTPADAHRIFVKTAARLSNVAQQHVSVNFAIGCHDVGNPFRLSSMQKIAQMELGGERAISEIAEAQRAAADIVKAQGVLPTATEVKDVTGVSDAAANVAIQQTAELIAAVGGQVISPEAAAMQSAPSPTPAALGAGGAAPTAGMMPGSPMMPAAAAPMPAGPPMNDPMMGVPPADPMMGAPPAPMPADPNAMPPGPPPAGGEPKTSSHRFRNVQEARQYLDFVTKLSAESADQAFKALDTGMVPATSPSQQVSTAAMGSEEPVKTDSGLTSTPAAAALFGSTQSMINTAADSLNDLRDRHIDKTFADGGSKTTLTNHFAAASTSDDQHIANSADKDVVGSLNPDNAAADGANGGTMKQSSAMDPIERLSQNLLKNLGLK